MIINAQRMLAAWLADAINGVNALLPSVPFAPDAPPPAIQQILTEYDAEEVGRGQIPEDEDFPEPALIIWQPEDATIPAGVTLQSITASSAPLVIEYLRRDLSTIAAKRAAAHTMRVIVRSLNRLLLHDAARQRNQILIEQITTYRPVRLFADIEMTTVVHGLLIECQLEDTLTT